jgi:hypothetical protein
MRRHPHVAADIPGLELPPPFPARGTEADLFNDDGSLQKETWSRPDGTIGETRLYSYNDDGSESTIVRTLFDIDGATVTDTFTYTWIYAADGTNTGVVVS